MVYKCFDKKSTGSGVDAKLNYQLVNKLHRQIIQTFKRRKVYSSFRDNIWSVDLDKYNRRIKYLFCAIDIFSKYVWVVPLKDKRWISIVNVFQRIISEGTKPNKKWVDLGGKFYNNLEFFENK